jgi:soluble lytic murein transglycosylase-like protein
MDPLRLLATPLALALAVPASADPVGRWQPFIAEATLRFGIPEAWIVRVMRAESGAMGLMQLMPGTWRDMRARLALGTDPDDPRDNILAGTLYLRLMYDRFGYPGLFGAYNAGPQRYAAWLAGRTRLPAETIDYLGKVGGQGLARREATAPPAPRLLFAVRRVPAAEPPPAPSATSRPSMFAIRKEP